MLAQLLDLGYHRLIKEKLFEQSKDDAEIAHRKAMRSLKDLNRHPWLAKILRWRMCGDTHYTKKRIFGCMWDNPVGLAAGFDKNAEALWGLAALGFGSLDIGAVLRFKQLGNKGVRMKRVPNSEDINNRMGFNSHGCRKVKNRLEHYGQLPFPVGINIGKNKWTPLLSAVDDYCHVLEELYELVDWFTINVSSPNTEGLRVLQEAGRLRQLLVAVIQLRNTLWLQTGLYRGIVAKPANDLPREQFEAFVCVCKEVGVDGLIIGNTCMVQDDQGVSWGRSGPSLFPLVMEKVSLARTVVGSSMSVVACGGINSSDRALAAMEVAGADGVQLLSALPHKGPGLPARIVDSLRMRATLSRIGS